MDINNKEIKSSGKVGKKRLKDWLYFSDRDDITKQKKAICKNCNHQISFERKIERVKTHLKKCPEFKQYCHQ